LSAHTVAVIPRNTRHRRSGARIVQPLATVILVVLVLGVPFWTILVNSAKSANDARTPDLALPTNWQFWQNLVQVFNEGSVGPAFVGSLILLVPSVVGVLLLGSLASWILARRKSRKISFLYAVGISGIIVPPAVVTVVLMLREIGLDGTAVGMIGVYMGMYLSTVMFFVTGFVRTIPVELEEAARVDGAGPIQVFFRIILPLLAPVLATATILVSLFIWNDVFYSLFVIGGRMATLPLNLYQVASSGLYLQNWNLIFMYVIVMSVPMILVFVIGQRRIIAGVTSGAVK
jgi:raffinose/stachyose/melibiose transport system permease protein